MILSGCKLALSFTEFVTLTAMILLMVLSIDGMLTALTEIAQDRGVQDTNDRQLVASVLFLGLAFGQLFYGPLSDTNVRKPAIYAGFGLFHRRLCTIYAGDDEIVGGLDKEKAGHNLAPTFSVQLAAATGKNFLSAHSVQCLSKCFGGANDTLQTGACDGVTNQIVDRTVFDQHGQIGRSQLSIGRYN